MEEHIDPKLIESALDGDIKAREYINTHIKKCLECKKKLQKMTREAWESLGGLEGAMNEALCTPDLTAKSDKCLTDKQMLDLLNNKERLSKLFSGVVDDKKIDNEIFLHILKCPYCRPTLFNYLYAKNIINIVEFEKQIEKRKRELEEIEKRDNQWQLKTFAVPIFTFLVINNVIQRFRKIPLAINMQVKDIEVLGVEENKFTQEIKTKEFSLAWHWEKVNDKWNVNFIFRDLPQLKDISVKLETHLGREVSLGKTDENGSCILKGIDSGSYCLVFSPIETTEMEVKITLENIGEIKDKDINSLIKLSDELIKEDKIIAAIQCLERALELSPKNIKALEKIVPLCLQQGMLQEVSKYLKHSDQKDIRIQFLLGMTYYHEKKYDDCIKLLEHVVTEEKEYTYLGTSYRTLVRCYSQKRKWNKIIDLIQETHIKKIINPSTDAEAIDILKRNKMEEEASDLLIYLLNSLTDRKSLELLALALGNLGLEEEKFLIVISEK